MDWTYQKHIKSETQFHPVMMSEPAVSEHSFISSCIHQINLEKAELIFLLFPLVSTFFHLLNILQLLIHVMYHNVKICVIFGVRSPVEQNLRLFILLK